MNSRNLECIWDIFDAHSIIWLALFPSSGDIFLALSPLTDYCNKWISVYLVWALPRV
jgi:hypothetical protein